MTASGKGTVILLPKTVDYYQIMLTRMLETDRFGEAADLLRFLLRCQPDDLRILEEWKALLAWLEDQFLQEGTAQLEDLSETDLLEERMQQRLQHDREYSMKLLEMLNESNSLEKQMLALEQLAYVKDEGLDEPIKFWLETKELHPLVQFKALQTLKLRQFEGSVTITRYRKTVTVEIEDVPLSIEQYPHMIRSPLIEVQEVCEIHSPSLGYFAEQLWLEFLSCIYETSIYHELLRMEDEEVNIWAAALHYSAMHMSGVISETEWMEMMPQYGLAEADWPSWQQKCELFQRVFHSTI